ncbi:MAG TPA: phosphoribosyltransferase [Candidatus Bathyarchaeia archaeon]|nr:phosphoribosyltransferase [Candidatus Bathyarchaeia archaeon]
MPNSKYEVPGWDQIYDMLVDLALQIRRSGYHPDVIVGVSRGGWPPARVMSDLLQKPNLANMKVEFYKDIAVTSKKPKITQPVTTIVRGKRVLVVDDVADTGHSLVAVVGHLRRKGAMQIKVSTIYVKPQSIFQPDFFAKKTRKWIIFPWERFEALSLITKKFDPKPNRTAAVLRELKDTGLGPRLVKRLLRMIHDDPKN